MPPPPSHLRAVGSSRSCSLGNSSSPEGSTSQGRHLNMPPMLPILHGSDRTIALPSVSRQWDHLNLLSWPPHRQRSLRLSCPSAWLGRPGWHFGMWCQCSSTQMTWCYSRRHQTGWWMLFFPGLLVPGLSGGSPSNNRGSTAANILLLSLLPDLCEAAQRDLWGSVCWDRYNQYNLEWSTILFSAQIITNQAQYPREFLVFWSIN